MKTSLPLCLTLTGALAACLPAQDTLVEKRDAKLASPFLRNGAWITDYEEALAAAEESGKPVFAYFTRSFAP